LSLRAPKQYGVGEGVSSNKETRVTTATVLLIALLALIDGAVILIIVWLALRDSRPIDRAAILRALAGLFFRRPRR
jgi:hypothetical protein